MNLRKQSWIFVFLFGFSLAILGATSRGNQMEQMSMASPAQAETGDPARGKGVFEEKCQLCHDAESTEARLGPGLKGLFKWPPHKLSDGTEHQTHTVELIRNQVVEGGGSMPPMGSSLSEAEVNDLIAYLQTL